MSARKKKSSTSTGAPNATSPGDGKKKTSRKRTVGKKRRESNSIARGKTKRTTKVTKRQSGKKKGPPKKTLKKKKRTTKKAARPTAVAKKAKRGATLRKGWDYQDLVAAESLLLLLDRNHEGPIAVELENREGGTFDDVVEVYHGYRIWKQVKWAAYPLTKPMTIDGFADAAKDGKSLLRSLAESWKVLQESGEKFEIQLVTRRYPDQEFINCLHEESRRLKQDLSRQQKQRIESAWRKASGLSDADFSEFLKKIQFWVGYPSEVVLKANIAQKLRSIGAAETALDRLLCAVLRWSTDQSIGEIRKEQVLGVIGVVADVPDNTFHIDTTTLVSRTSVHTQLKHLIDASEGAYVVLLGPPGYGKSTILNTLKNSLKNKPYATMVYNCFTRPKDSYLLTRATAENFLAFINAEMLGIANIVWERRRSVEREFEATLERAAVAVSPERRLLIVIDGIDYARANKTHAKVSLFDSLPPKPPANATIVVSAQDIQQLPEYLQSLSPSQYVQVPAFTQGQTRELLEKSGVFGHWGVSSDYRKEQATLAVERQTQGHPLCIQYVCKWLCAADTREAKLGVALEELSACEGDIRQWYQQLPIMRDAYVRALLYVLATCPCSLRANEADSLLATPRDPYYAENALRNAAFLLREKNSRWSFAHDSLREFVLQQQGAESVSPEKVFDLLLSLREDDRVGEYLPRIAAEANKLEWARRSISADWIAERISDGARAGDVAKGISCLLEHAIAREDWRDAARWSLLTQRVVVVLQEQIRWRRVYATWAAMGYGQRVSHSLIQGGQLKVSPREAFDVARDLSKFGYEKESEELGRMGVMTPFAFKRQIVPSEWSHEVLPYVGDMALRCDPYECLQVIEELVSWSEDALVGHAEDVEYRRRELIIRAVRTCEQAGDWTRVMAWCDSDASLGDSLEKYFTACLVLQKRLSTRKCPAQTMEKLAEWCPANFLSSAATHPRFAAAIAKGMRKRALPLKLLEGGFRSIDSDAVERDTIVLFSEVVLAHRLGLGERLQAMKSSVGGPPWNKGSLLYILTLRTAEGLIEGRGEGWRACADELIKVVAQSRFEQIPRNEQQSLAGVWQSLRFLLGKVAAAAGGAGGNEGLFAFGKWLREEFVVLPAFGAMNYYEVAHNLLHNLYFRVARPSEALSFLSEMESEADQSREIKTWRFLHIAERMAELRAYDDARRVLHKAIRAGMTYDYHKDCTIWAVINTLPVVSTLLGNRVRESVAVAAAVIELIDDLTDHDEHSCLVPEFVAAIATFDREMSARVAAQFERTVGTNLSRSSIATSLRSRGFDAQAVESHYSQFGVNIYDARFPEEKAHSTSQNAFEDETLSGLVKRCDEARKQRLDHYEEARELEAELLRRIEDEDSLEQVESCLVKETWGRYWILLKLALAAQAAGLMEDARRLARASAQGTLDDGFVLWSWERTHVLSSVADIIPEDAYGVLLESAKLSANSEPQWMGYDFVETLIKVLCKCGKRAEAAAVFGELCNHIREIIKPYPNSENEWIAVLASSDEREKA